MYSYRQIPPVLSQSIWIAAVVLLLSVVTARAEDSTAKAVEDYFRQMDQVRKDQQGHPPNLPVPQFKEIPLVENYRKSGDPRVRYDAYRMVMLSTHRTTNTLEKQRGVEMCLEAFKDPDEDLRSFPLRLGFLQARDFSENAKDIIRREIQKQETPALDLVLLVGVADITSELDHLAELKKQDGGVFENLAEKYRPSNLPGVPPVACPWGGSVAWAAAKARARMGVKEEIEFCINLVEGFPDEEYRVKSLLRDLSYVRQPEVIVYLRKYLSSDKKIRIVGSPVPSGNPGVAFLPYSTCATDALREMIRNASGTVLIKNGKVVWSSEPMSNDKIREITADPGKVELLR
jgi:hypothetical protein